MKARLFHLFVVWLTVYVGVTGSLLIIHELIPGIPLAVQTLVITAILVPLILLVIGPAAARLAGRTFPPCTNETSAHQD
ncbi:hypothetical protein [Henriciella litoralis]|uniref:hypothetical protein n=1 Tax=Henriciella litoralis TaxID=568102 RepID=UPI000A02847E|nr:hypothetical protein [Henriciella litoralis]